MSIRSITVSKSQLLTAVLVVAACAVALWITLGFATSSQSPNLQDAEAVEKAAKWAGLSGPSFGGLMGAPSEVSGEIVTLNESVMLLDEQPISSESQEWESKDDLVWVLVFAAPVDGSRGGEGSTVEYSQMAVVMDSETGELIARYINPEGHTTDTSSLRDMTEHYPAE